MGKCEMLTAWFEAKQRSRSSKGTSGRHGVRKWIDIRGSLLSWESLIESEEGIELSIPRRVCLLRL